MDKDRNLKYSGIPVSSGISIGTAKLLLPENEDFSLQYQGNVDVDFEIERFEKTTRTLIKEIEDLITTVSMDSKNVLDILESNILILSDPVINDSIIQTISENKRAEYAINKEYKKHIKQFQATKDTYLQTRAEELDYLRKRIIYFLRHKLSDILVDKSTILITQNLTPADIVYFKNAGVIGIVTEAGGITSHVSIMSRAYKIPAIIGVKNIANLVKDKSNIILDALSGVLIVNPDEETFFTYHKKQRKVEEYQENLKKLINVESKTKDGTEINIHINIDLREDIITGNMVGATGVGLVRSESHIIKNARIPTFEEQYEWYKDIAELTYPKIATIRAYDIGSDKFPEALPHKEYNPALGCRGIRFLLSRKDIFRSQIKAILMASNHKNIRIMLPMISAVEEVITAKSIIKGCMNSLDKEGIQYDKNIPIGIMIETPAAAITAESYIPYVDFFSIGTNDLTQYALGADRENDLISNIFNPMHPAIFKFIKMITDVAIKHNISVTVCGEIGAYSEAIPILIGLGITEISVSPAVVLEIKNTIINIDKAEAIKLATKYY